MLHCSLWLTNSLYAWIPSESLESEKKDESCKYSNQDAKQTLLFRKFRIMERELESRVHVNGQKKCN